MRFLYVLVEALAYTMIMWIPLVMWYFSGVGRQKK